MFNQKKNGLSSAVEGFSINSIGQGSTFKGDIEAHMDMRIDGHVIGNIQCNARIIIGKTGSVMGDVKCKSAIIEGGYEGHLYVAESLEVHSTANLKGEVSTEKLIVENGAIFHVICNMAVQNTKAETKK